MSVAYFLHPRLLQVIMPTVLSKPKTFKKLSAEEIRLARMWYHDDDKEPSEIADLLHRDKSTLTRLLVKQVERKKQGRPAELSKDMINKMEATLERMIRKAKGEYRVTAEMLKTALKLKVSVRRILEALHSRGIYWHTMRQKPLLTDDDIAARYEFAKRHHRKPVSWWLHSVDMIIDVKYFKIYLSKAARSRAAKEGVWGVFRKRGQGLEPAYVRPSKRLAWNPGARGVHVLAGVGQGKVMLWEYIDGKKWCGHEAGRLYRGPVTSALEQACPGRRSYKILEDNDPTGFRSKAGLAAKSDCGINVLEIPKRSPQLNVCDYALWTEVEKRMRRQEKSFRPSFRESRVAFKRRLRRTAMRLPAHFINDSIADMKERCARLLAAKGGQFEEGGS